jgi:hypothetical protein
MHQPDFWTRYAETMELSIEGERLIAIEIADAMRTLWRRFGNVVRMPGRHQHLPPF